MSYNLWLYGNANPSRFVDPTGYKPNPDTPGGYVEGRSYTASALLVMAIIEGEEIVYDFATLERGRFHYTGVLAVNGSPNIPTGFFSSILNISGSPYVSAVFGFDEGDSIKIDYSRPFVAVQAGPDIPIPITLGLVSVGGGVVGFSSVFPNTSIPNLDVWGLTAYMDVSGGTGVWDLPIWLAIYKTNYTLIEHKVYDDVLQMAEDIKTGNNSPIVLPFIGRDIRNFAANSAMKYRILLEQ